MTIPEKHIIIIAGEASGDMHAARLVKALKAMDPGLTFSGLGGQSIRQSGVELYKDMTQIAVIGFVEVLKHYAEFKKIFRLILDKIDERRPQAVILVDYPGFNLRLAREIKKRNIKVIYYISPQVWAWKKDRVRQIKENVHTLLVIFPFEVSFYAPFGVRAHFVGHPLVDRIKVNRTTEESRRLIGFNSARPVIGILPGSRNKEIENLLPVMVQAAQILKKEFPILQFAVIQAPTISRSLIERHIPRSLTDIKIVENTTTDGLNACDVCMVASGTATLETALLQKPMVIVYKTALLTWILAKMLVKIPHIGLVNIVAGKKVVPECIQFDATGPRVAQEVKDILTDEPRIAQIKGHLMDVKKSLGDSGASHRAAQEVLKAIN